MFGTGTRFAEYGITGGVFLFLHTMIIGLLFPENFFELAGMLSKNFSVMIDRLPETARSQALPALQSLLVALTLLSVFVIGFLLDLVGSAFMLLEAGRFRRHVMQNEAWIGPLIEKELPDYDETYRAFLLLSSRIRFGAIWPEGWPFQWWPKWSSDGGLRHQRRVQQLLRRLEFAFIAKVLASGGRTEPLSEQMSICRMSRAISVALYALCFEFMVLTSADQSLEHQFGLRGLLIVVVIVATFLCGALVMAGAYSRFCLILFSMLYVTSRAPRAP